MCSGTSGAGHTRAACSALLRFPTCWSYLLGLGATNQSLKSIFLVNFIIWFGFI